jgi:hypothetical protein
LKTILISSAASIAIGFTFGWLIRSATVDLESIEKTHIVLEKQPSQPPSKGSPLDVPPERLSPSDIDRAMDPKQGSSRISAKPPETAEKEEQAKWNRLIEILGLDETQAKILAATISETAPVPEEGQQLDEAYAEAGERLQAKILAILDADQAKAFKELQQRSLKNQLNAKAMQQYAQELDKLDLDASQTDQALGVLLDHAEEEASAIPQSTRLLLDGSVLPIGGQMISDVGYALLTKLSATNTGGAMGIDEIASIHRAEMERRMTQFGEIFTPAQLERYQAGIKESSENLDKIAPRN